MALDVRGKTALVTGAGRGICFAFAERLVQAGCNVVIADLALTEEAEQLIKTSADGSGKAIFIKTDVTDWYQLEAAFDKAVNTFNRLDIVCPGAGIFDPTPFGFWNFDANGNPPERSTYKTFDINISHPIRCTQLAIDCFRRQKLGHGVVVHISSVAAQMVVPVVPLYSASKAAISSFVRSMGFLEPAYNIRINAVAPANVLTPIWKDGGRQHYHDASKGDEWVTPARIADVMMDLITKEEYVGGGIWEVGVESLRKVEGLNDPGPDFTKRGFTLANVGVARTEVAELLEKNFGK